jgi:murein DD-endopeptidase MepM/ murein hydrolase activator NlpD
MHIKKIILLLCCISNVYLLVGQGREKGRIKKSTVIKPNNPYYKESDKKKDDLDFLEEDVPKQILDKQYVEENVPYKAPENRSVVSVIDSTNLTPTTKISEGKNDILEVEEEVQLGETSEDWIKVADYFAVWNEKAVDPYDIDPKDFEGPVVIDLVDRVNNRLSSSPTNSGPGNSITSRFGYRWGRIHAGVDVDLNTGDPVYAAFDGIVRLSSWNGGFGNCIVIRHYNGLETVYGHLSKQEVPANTYVKAGDLIGLGGSTGHSTGSHLHFETRYEGNPFNPMEIFVFPAGVLKADQLILTPETFGVARSGGAYEFAEGAKVHYRKSVFLRVKPGDTLYGIADRYNISASELARKNKISLNGNLLAGRRLRIR